MRVTPRFTSRPDFNRPPVRGKKRSAEVFQGKFTTNSSIIIRFAIRARYIEVEDSVETRQGINRGLTIV